MKLIDKDAVVAEIERLIKSPILYKSENVETRISVLEYLLSFLDTLKVKEVDLEKELDTICNTCPYKDSAKWLAFRKHL